MQSQEQRYYYHYVTSTSKMLLCKYYIEQVHKLVHVFGNDVKYNFIQLMFRKEYNLAHWRNTKWFVKPSASSIIDNGQWPLTMYNISPPKMLVGLDLVYYKV
jgi:hypothetical protein